MSTRTAVVTGAASGIGAALRARLERDGWEVIGVDLADAGLRDGDIAADLATASGRTAMADQVAERSDGVLHGLVACAGVGPHLADHAVIVSVNHFGAVATLDALRPLLEAGLAAAVASARDGGLGADASAGGVARPAVSGLPAAVAISSNSVGLVPPDDELLTACLEGDEEAARLRSAELDGATVYGTSKRALAFAVRQRAQEWGEAGVRLNAVAPGPIDTPLLQATIDDLQLGPTVDLLPIPLGRHGRADEIAAVVAFLLGPDSSLVHGALLWADGGTDALIRPTTV